MSGYAGYSKSNNALQAESENKFPLSIAVKELAKQAGITQKRAREIFAKIGHCEWHHSSKMYNRVNYYSVTAGLQELGINACSEETIEKIKAILKSADMIDFYVNEVNEAIQEQNGMIIIMKSDSISGDLEYVYF